jgi:hypothetical protein
LANEGRGLFDQGLGTFNEGRVLVYERVWLLDKRSRLQHHRLGPVHERSRLVYERVGLVYKRSGVGRYFPTLPVIRGEFSVLIIAGVLCVGQGLGRIRVRHVRRRFSL